MLKKNKGKILDKDDQKKLNKLKKEVLILMKKEYGFKSEEDLKSTLTGGINVLSDIQKNTDKVIKEETKIVEAKKVEEGYLHYLWKGAKYLVDTAKEIVNKSLSIFNIQSDQIKSKLITTFGVIFVTFAAASTICILSKDTVEESTWFSSTKKSVSACGLAFQYLLSSVENIRKSIIFFLYFFYILTTKPHFKFFFKKQTN